MTEQKRRAAEAALAFVCEGAYLGVGTGSTTEHFIDLLAARGPGVRGAVASSARTEARLRARGINVVSLETALKDELLPVYIDGADEFAPDLCLLKGGGGALTREKIVAEAALKFVCIVDAAKRVSYLGGFGLPVEVLPMARPLAMRKLASLGGVPVVRDCYLTDNGNEIIDVSGLRIDDAVALETILDGYPGIVACGLFARRRADSVLMGTESGVEHFTGS